MTSKQINAKHITKETFSNRITKFVLLPQAEMDRSRFFCLSRVKCKQNSTRERDNVEITHWITAGSKGNVGHVVTGNDRAAFQRTNSETAAADGQCYVTTGVLHVRSIAQDPLDSSVHLRRNKKKERIYIVNVNLALHQPCETGKKRRKVIGAATINDRT